MYKASHDSESPAIGQQVLTACVSIHQNFEGVEKVFLPKRAETKKFMPGIFELPGGHIDFGEDMVEGVKREVLEEIEMKISVGDPFYVFVYENNVKECQSIEVIYFAKFIDPIDKIVLHPEDHSEYGWFSEDEIASKVVSNKKPAEDKENIGIMRGFALLRGAKLNFE